MTPLEALIKMLATTWPDGEINIKARDGPVLLYCANPAAFGRVDLVGWRHSAKPVTLVEAVSPLGFTVKFEMR